MKAKIRLEGKLENEVTMNKEGKYVSIFKSSISSIEKSESIFFIEMTKNQWESIKNKDDRLVITGRIIVKKNKKDMPFVYVICTGVSNGMEKNKKIKDEDIEEVLDNKKYLLETDTSEKNIYKDNFAWFNKISPEKFIEVDIENIKITQSCHKAFKCFINVTEQSTYDIEKPIAARHLGNGEYELLVGLQSYIKSKLFDKKLKVFVTDLTREEFEKKYKIINK